MNFDLGCKMDLKDWLWLNRVGCFESPNQQKYVSPFPPKKLMENVSGLTSEKDFASHGVDLYKALTEASPKALNEFRSILDLGCGCGRLARMFKGHPYKVSGCDIDKRHIDWINNNLEFVDAKHSHIHPPLPYNDGEFEAIISISIFTHLNERSQDEFLADLRRVSSSDGYLFLTVHGERALSRAKSEKVIWDMLSIDQNAFDEACSSFSQGNHAFILQDGHLTTVGTKKKWGKAVSEPFEYGITFIPEIYIEKHWTKWFDLVEYRHGAIHDFQDIVVLKPKR